jgi:hypothetical protein
MPPEGSWRPNVSLGSVLVTILVLLGAPNLDDPVRPDLISEWQQVKVKECDDEDENDQIAAMAMPTVKRNFSLSLSAARKKLKAQISDESPK